MARSTIFITHYVTEKTIRDDYRYSYLEEEGKGILRVYKGEQKFFEQEANIGDAFEVIMKIGKQEDTLITPVTPPRKDWEAIAWLLGFTKHERVATYEEYTKLLEKKLDSFNATDYVESILSGPNFEFAEYSQINGKNHEYYRLACWVDVKITKNEICHLIPEFVYPEEYVKKLLSQRFGISNEEFQKALYGFD